MKKAKKIIVGNWKMNPVTSEEAVKIVSTITREIISSKNVEAVICPSFLHLPLVARYNKKKKIILGAQNIFQDQKGSFTGEVSIDMVKDAGVKYVIVGHSERRKLGETDEIVNKKVHLVLAAELIPIICIGEEKRDDEGHYLGFIKNQIQQALRRVGPSQLTSIIFAYEPIFAIGAAEAMKSNDVHGMTIFIKRTIMELYKIKAVTIPILYGGAVDPTNAHSILTIGDADGLLIGRQSLDAKSFLDILTSARDIK